MQLRTENVGSLPRPMKLQEAIADYDAGKVTKDELKVIQDEACKDSIKRMETIGAPIVSDGEQRVSSFATYPLAGTGLADNLAGDGQHFAIFTDGHHRQLPRLTGGPIKYKTYASEFSKKRKRSPINQLNKPSLLLRCFHFFILWTAKSKVTHAKNF